jgi:hypothetical protein
MVRGRKPQWQGQGFFLGFNAGVTLQPVMNADDLKKGLSKIS